MAARIESWSAARGTLYYAQESFKKKRNANICSSTVRVAVRVNRLFLGPVNESGDPP